MFLGVCVVSFACFLLGRMAFVEVELAARFSGLADALCVAGNDFEQLKKATNLLFHKLNTFPFLKSFRQRTANLPWSY